MPRTVQYTREQILAAAVEMTRRSGFEAVTARELGAALGTSSKPVYTVFQSMGELKNAVVAEAARIFEEFAARERDSGRYPSYKATGMAYIRFAREEKNLFRLLYMRDRTGEDTGPDASYNDNVAAVRQQTGLEEEKAQLFHVEMWVAVHGIATMFATGYLDWDMDLASRMLTDLYNGLQAGK